MKARWQQWSALFAARQPREKWMLGLVALVLAYALVDAVWLTPAANRLKLEGNALTQKQADLQRLAEQVRMLDGELQTQERLNREAIAAGKRELGSLAEELARFEQTMVPARRMTEFLQSLLPGRGIEVVALRTLPPEALVTRPAAPPAAPGAAPAAAASPAAPEAMAANLYRHGVEIKLAGSFPALLDYLDRLEKSPQKLLFGHMELSAEKYPRSELTLTLYTLSLDRSWLIV